MNKRSDFKSRHQVSMLLCLASSALAGGCAPVGADDLSEHNTLTEGVCRPGVTCGVVLPQLPSLPGPTNEDFRVVSSRDPGLCVEVPAGSFGNLTLARMAPCIDGYPLYSLTIQQDWRVRPVAGQPGLYTVMSAQSGRCLDVWGWGTSAGTTLQQYDCHGGANQQFRVRHVGGERYELRPAHSGLCVSGRANGATVTQEVCDAADNAQRFLLQRRRTQSATGLIALVDASAFGAGLPATPAVPTALRATCGDLSVNLSPGATAQDAINASRGAVNAAIADAQCINPGNWRVNTGGCATVGCPYNCHLECAPPSATCGTFNVSVGSAYDAINRVRAQIDAAARNSVCLDPRRWTLTVTATTPLPDALRRAGVNLAALSAQAAAEAMITSAAQCGASVPRPSCYDTVLVLRGADVNPSRLRDLVQEYGVTHRLDVHVLTGGARGGFGPGLSFDAGAIAALHDIPGADIRAVYQQNSYGAALNSAWVSAGADVVSGAAGIDYMPGTYTAFLTRWLAGNNAQTSVVGAFNDPLQRPVYEAIYQRVDLYDDSDTLRSMPVVTPMADAAMDDDEIAASAPVIAGNSGLRIR